MEFYTDVLPLLETSAQQINDCEKVTADVRKERDAREAPLVCI
jgi:hypothetical protein